MITGVKEGTFIGIKEGLYFGIKRSFDILLSCFGIIFLLPIALIIKIVSLLNKDTKSIFYTQNRIGKDGKEFKLLKFRSMVPNADQILEELLKNDKTLSDEYNTMKKLEKDPRITKIGHILRKTSIDELPQLINILKGEMTFIGNRPYLPREKKDMGSYYNDIIKTKPGLTGYWQVSLRSRGTFNERLIMEQYYSNNYSLKLDVKILFKTFGAVLFCNGAK